MGSEKTFSITVRKANTGMYLGDVQHNGDSLSSNEVDRAFPESSPIRARLDDLFNYCKRQIPGETGSYELNLSEAELLYAFQNA